MRERIRVAMVGLVVVWAGVLEAAPPAATLQGKVTLEGVPVPGATICLRQTRYYVDPALPFAVETQTDEAGQFEVKDLPPGQHSVVAISSGQSLGSENVEVEPGDPSAEVTIEAVQRERSTIEGSLLGPGSNPAVGWLVSTEGWNRCAFEATAVTSDAQGHFRIEVLGKALWTVLRTRPPGAHLLTTHHVESTPTLIIVPDYARVRGNLAGRVPGLPPEALEVWVRPVERITEPGVRLPLDGTRHFEGFLPVGRYEVSASVLDRVDSRVTRKVEVNLKPGRPAQASLKVDRRPPPAHSKDRVLDTGGQPIRNTLLEIWVGDRTNGLVTDYQGYLPTGWRKPMAGKQRRVLNLWDKSTGRSARVKNFLRGMPPLAASLQPGRSVEVIAKTPEDTIVRKGQVRLTIPGYTPLRSCDRNPIEAAFWQRDLKGSPYRLEDLPRLALEFEVSTADGQTGTVRVPAGGPPNAPLVVRLQPK